MKVAITGAAGYVGGLLVRAHAERGDLVHALARDAGRIADLPGVTRVGVDLVEPERVPASFFEQADVVYHCAAEIAREPLMRAVNVAATRVLLERARGHIQHWVQVSSLSVYGRPREAVITEETPPAPASVYARSKVDADEQVLAIANGAFGYTIVRPSGVLGPNMRHRSMYSLIEAVARGRFAFIGRPGAIGNFVHEDDIRDALLRCGTQVAARDRTFNVSRNPTIERMIGAIAEALGQPLPRLRIPEGVARVAAGVGRFIPGFPLSPGRVAALTSRVEYPTRRIEDALGYRSGKSVEEGLRELVALWKTGRP